MDTRYLQTLLDVVEGGSLAAAARRRNLTPAAVGQRLRTLEAELGAPLVRRAGPTVRPTPACQRFLPRIRRILAETALLPSDLAHNALAGPYRLGGITTALSDHIPQLLDHIRTKAPAVELIITPGASAHLYTMLSNSELDAAILVEPSFELPKSVMREVLERQPFAWITPSQHNPKDLPLIVYDRASWGGGIAWRWIEHNVSTPNVLCEIDAPETVASLVASGAGRAVLPVWAGLSAIAGIDIKVIETLPERSLIFAHRASPIDETCIAFLKG